MPASAPARRPAQGQLRPPPHRCSQPPARRALLLLLLRRPLCLGFITSSPAPEALQAPEGLSYSDCARPSACWALQGHLTAARLHRRGRRLRATRLVGDGLHWAVVASKPGTMRHGDTAECLGRLPPPTLPRRPQKWGRPGGSLVTGRATQRTEGWRGLPWNVSDLQTSGGALRSQSLCWEPCRALARPGHQWRAAQAAT